MRKQAVTLELMKSSAFGMGTAKSLLDILKVNRRKWRLARKISKATRGAASKKEPFVVRNSKTILPLAAASLPTYYLNFTDEGKDLLHRMGENAKSFTGLD